jgi:hypothetical protein
LVTERATATDIMDSEAITYPFMYWVGMDTDPRTTPDDLAEFNRFYSMTHVHEVVAAHPGFVTANRYELVDPDPLEVGQQGPRWLAMYGMQDEQAAQQYLKDNARPWLHRQKYSPWPRARRRAKTVWRMIWRQLTVVGSPNQPGESLLIVGTDTHMDTDLVDAGHARATTLELFRSFAHPEPGPPQFAIVHESSTDLTIPAAPEPRDTRWRLKYRRVPRPAP